MNSSIPKDKQTEPTSQINSNLIFAAAATAFIGGIGGALIYTRRKNVHHPPDPFPNLPVMTPQQQLTARSDAFKFAFKTFGYGTLLALSGFGLLATGVGWYLGVNNLQEFSEKMQEIIPRRASSLRDALLREEKNGSESSAFYLEEKGVNDVSGEEFIKSLKRELDQEVEARRRKYAKKN